MKKELKISIMTVACVLCAAVVMPAFSASSVRSLGGAGTYAGTASAAAAKTNGESAGDAVSSVRAGSLRVNNAAGATRSGSTRAATTPRLSIGKYLSGSSALSGGSSVSGSHAGKPGPGTSSGDVKYLEEFVGYTTNGDTLPQQLSSIILDVEGLRADVESVTGFVSDVSFDEAEGKLTVLVDGEEPVVYSLSDYFDGAMDSVDDKVEALQGVLDDIVAEDGRLSEFYTKEETEALLSGYAKKGADAEIDAAMLDLGDAGKQAVSEGGGLLMLQTNGDGTSEWINVQVD